MIDMEKLNNDVKKLKRFKKIKISLIIILVICLSIFTALFTVKIITLQPKHQETKNIEKTENNEQQPYEENLENQEIIVQNKDEIEVLKGQIVIKTKEKVKIKEDKSKKKKNKKKSKKQKEKIIIKKEKLNVELHTKNGDLFKVVVNGKEEKNEKRKKEIVELFNKQVLKTQQNKDIEVNSVEKTNQTEENNSIDEQINNINDKYKKENAEKTLKNLQIEMGQQTDLFKNETEKQNQNLSYDKLVEKLSSSVVHIKGIYLTDANDMHRYNLLQALDGEVFPAKKIKVQATCSGFFVSEDGYIVTNHHCIDDAKDIDIETKNGNKYEAKIIGYFEGADIALLKIEPKKGEKFNAVKIANSDNLAVGDNIIIIGGPLGYKWSASAGIVSGKSRALDEFQDGPKKHAWGTAGEYIQVDAAINGGNSGGPAFNTNGEVVGIAAAGYDFLQGMKFIISSNTLLKNLDQLKKGKIIQKGLWGVAVNELEPYDIKAVGLNKNSGLLVHNVVEKSPADKAGLKRGDVILKVNGKELKDKIALKDVNSEIFDGSVSELEINRYGKIKKIKIKAISVKEIEKLEKGEIGIQDWDDKNISYRLLTSGLHKKLRFPKEVSGIIITDIKNNEDPMLILAVGDIIVGVNDEKISSIEDYQKVLKQLRKDKKEMAMFHIYKPTKGVIVVRGSKFE